MLKLFLENTKIHKWLRKVRRKSIKKVNPPKYILFQHVRKKVMFNIYPYTIHILWILKIFRKFRERHWIYKDKNGFIIESFETTDVLQKERNFTVEETFLKSNRPLNVGNEKVEIFILCSILKRKFNRKCKKVIEF